MEEDIRYKSILSKETLIYNLIYHLRDCKNEEDSAARIRSVLENFEDKEKEFSMYENVQSLPMMAQMMSPYTLESEYVVSDYDNKAIIKLKNFELTEEIIENWNQQSLKMLKMLGCFYDDSFLS